MITKELTDYIKAERAAGMADDAIKQNLVAGGWSMVDAQEAFSSLNAAPIAAAAPAPAAPAAAAAPASVIPPQSSKPLVQTFKPIQSPAMTMPTTGAEARAAMSNLQPAPKAKKGGGFLIVLVVLLLLGGAGAYAYVSDMIPFLSAPAAQEDYLIPAQPANQEASATTSSPVENTTAPIATSTTSAASATTAVASTSSQGSSVNLWPVVDAYVAALKSKDLVAANAVSYTKLATVTAALYDDVAPLREADFGSRVQDGKQAIYSSYFAKDGFATSTAYSRNVLIFIRDGEVWKVIKEPKRVWSVAKTASSTDAQIDAALQAISYDADKDGLTDMEEDCLGSRASDRSCVKTDPNKIDTDGDGWWDGIEGKLK